MSPPPPQRGTPYSCLAISGHSKPKAETILITSRHGRIESGTWGAILGNLKTEAADALSRWAFNSVLGQVLSDGSVQILSHVGDIAGEISAKSNAYVRGVTIRPDFISAGGKVYAYADQSSTTSTVSGQRRARHRRSRPSASTNR